MSILEVTILVVQKILPADKTSNERLPPLKISDALQELIDVEPDFVKLRDNDNGKRYSKIINPLQQRIYDRINIAIYYRSL
ncbi:hypothetical protein MJO28_015567 [Puccinia striiformis f. sp. tritici]|uniref:Uncharacterized protein n=1 Tax=Puccinia striiformis f. sp. tritici TaxID=168172 RepID=A0ACC0DPF2_9BASI|nr:hypothetical protein MJO28_015567 [Puccinia striiformis f. sp. tritici]